MSAIDRVVHFTLRVVLAMAILLLAGCALRIALTTLGGRLPIENTGRALLVGTAQEHEGFGIYSYLLFGGRPLESSRGRYLAAIRAYITLIADNINELECYSSRKKLNITYLPVQRPSEKETPEHLLAIYNYARAQKILNALIAEGPLGAGPYIVSWHRPLTNATVTEDENYLFQDLSSIPEQAVPLWVTEFLNRVRKPTDWNKYSLKQFALQLRAAIENMDAFVHSLPKEIKENLHSFLGNSIFVRYGRR